MSTWYEAIEGQEQEDGIGLKEFDITSTPNDFNIQTLFSLIDNGVIKMPPFQRNYVWDIKRASKLIESIILGLPVPQVFLYEKGRNIFFVIDGQQRLLSIYFFMKQRFPTEVGRDVLREYLTGDNKIDNSILANDDYFKNFSLNLPSPAAGEKNKLDKLKYETLGEYKYTFEILRTIRSVVIKQNEPDDDSAIYEIFNRLNTGGQNLSPQEIRMSLYYSDFYKAIIEMNRSPRWREILNQQIPDIHFKDVEILIRSFAMLHHCSKSITTYGPPMSKFLNTFSKTASAFDEKNVKYHVDLFESFLKSCEDIRPEKFATENGQFRISLFESIFVAACADAFINGTIVEKLIDVQSVDELRRDTQLLDATQGSVASKKNVDTRINRAKTLLKLV